jgi:hypothetical protein
MSGRYADSLKLTYAAPDGQRVRYLAPRMLPTGDTIPAQGYAVVRADELHRLDLIAHRTLGKAELAWQIADANDAMNPFGLCARIGQGPLRVPGRTT